MCVVDGEICGTVTMNHVSDHIPLMKQTWTNIQQEGPNHLGFWSNQAYAAHDFASAGREDTDSFGSLAVDPAFQRNGVGALLVGAAETRARERGKTRMELCFVHGRCFVSVVARDPKPTHQSEWFCMSWYADCEFWVTQPAWRPAEACAVLLRAGL